MHVRGGKNEKKHNIEITSSLLTLDAELFSVGTSVIMCAYEIL